MKTTSDPIQKMHGGSKNLSFSWEGRALKIKKSLVPECIQDWKMMTHFNLIKTNKTEVQKVLNRF